MRRIGYVIVALAIVLGFGSCNKENVPEVVDTLVFHVSANASDGSKAVVDPEGNVIFQPCDYLYLAYKGINNNSCLSKGTGGNAVFSGKMKVPATVEVDGKEPLHFFGLAGVTGKGAQDAYWTEAQLTTGTKSTRTCISLQNLGKNSDGTMMTDKIRNMPYLCYGVSREKFPTGNGKYTVNLKNKCAMVKYNVVGIPYDKEIYIEGLNNVVAVDFGVPYNNIPENRDADYDDDGFMFLADDGIIQKEALLTPGADKIVKKDGSTIKVRDIIIPYRNEPEKKTDATYCYSLLLPQKEVGTLYGYYFDDEEKVDLTIKIIDSEGKPATKILENWYYEINIGIKQTEN